LLRALELTSEQLRRTAQAAERVAYLVRQLPRKCAARVELCAQYLLAPEPHRGLRVTQLDERPALCADGKQAHVHVARQRTRARRTQGERAQCEGRVRVREESAPHGVDERGGRWQELSQRAPERLA